MAKRTTKRDEELAGKKPIKDALVDVFRRVTKGFEDQKQRTEEIFDNWDLYNCILGDKQFYNGNSQIFMPFVRDAVDARVTRFANQMFPQSGRYVDVTSGEADTPDAITAILEAYVRKSKMRTQVIPPLLRNGDMEGQYTLYVGWKDTKRQPVHRVKRGVKLDGIEQTDVATINDLSQETVRMQLPEIEVISDPDFLVLPATSDSIEDALEGGGSVTVLRRWTKGKIKKMIAQGDLLKEEGDALIGAMSSRSNDANRDVAKENASAAGIKAEGRFAAVYETWTVLDVFGVDKLCRAYSDGERLLGCKQNPFWNDRCPIVSAPVSKVAGVFKGKPPVSAVADLQIFANDTINEGADTAHFSAMPIVMTDPLKNPRIATMVLGLAAVWETSPTDTQFAEFPDLWRSALDRAGAIKAQIFQTLSVNPSMVAQQTGGASKRNQAEIANEQQVDLLTTADAVTGIEEGILTPTIERFAEYDHQFRDETVTVRLYGEMGLRATMESIEPIQINTRFEFRWFGVESARNAAQIQQQIAAVNVLRGLPPQLYPDYDLDISPAVVQMVENAFGPRLGPLVFKRKRLWSLDPELENGMLENGFMVSVNPDDDDAEHIQAHMELMQAAGDPHGNIRDHLVHHQEQMQKKALGQAAGVEGANPNQGFPGVPGGAGPGVAGTPRPGGQPEMPRQLQGPAGGIPPDSMPAAGAVDMPRSM